ncbi:MAG: class I SAM-dependent methyltransferase, partial [Chloroflexi bacterium]|nr:class I SAM-dependent methyltransferase [Chloroflexota bacterium]
MDRWPRPDRDRQPVPADRRPRQPVPDDRSGEQRVRVPGRRTGRDRRRGTRRHRRDVHRRGPVAGPARDGGAVRGGGAVPAGHGPAGGLAADRRCSRHRGPSGRGRGHRVPRGPRRRAGRRDLGAPLCALPARGSADRVTVEAAFGYDEIAERYARWWAPVLAPSARLLLDRLADVVAGQPDATIVDLGTGTGTVATAALERWPEVRVIGIDSSARMLALAEAAAAAAPAPDRFRALRADVAGLPLPDASADAVTSSFVLQLVDVRRALAEAHRVLRPGGALAVVTWMGPDAPFEPDLALDDALDELEIVVPDDDDDDEDDGTSGHFETADELVDVVRGAGFQAIEAVESTLHHDFDPRTYGEFLEEYGERALFTSLDPADARRLRRLTDRYLRDLEPEQFRWQTAIVTV